MLSVSIVTYHSSPNRLRKTVYTLAHAIEQSGIQGQLYIVDNGDDISEELFESLTDFSLNISHIKGHGNIGYGRGHNLAITRTESPYHLVLNPDVEVSQDAITEAFKFISSHPDCGLVAPAAFGPDGVKLYLCKEYPSLVDLALRGSSSRILRGMFNRRLARYEMKDMVDMEEVHLDPRIVCGCFAIFKTDVLKALGGFDPRFFLYFEDFDISLRAAEITRIAYVPSVRIVHYGGHASKKGINHIVSFTISAAKFFSKHGWRFF